MKDRRSSGKRRAKRRYRMVARAEAAAETRQRIIDSAEELFRERPFAEVTLDAIAERAGVTRQTVLRRFGSKDGLLGAAAEERRGQVERSRTPDDPTDTEAALRLLISSYEKMGDLSWRALCQEDEFPEIQEMLGQARASHRTWIERCFGPWLPAEAGPERDDRTVLLFAATDFYLWKLLRRDLGLNREATERAIGSLVEALKQTFLTPPSLAEDEE